MSSNSRGNCIRIRADSTARSSADDGSFRRAEHSANRAQIGETAQIAVTGSLSRTEYSLRGRSTALDRVVCSTSLPRPFANWSCYQASATIYELAELLNIHRTTVSLHLQRQGVAMRRQGLSRDQIDQTAELYEQGLSLVRVAERLHVNAETVRQALRKRGVQMRRPWERS
jgi:lambda repressor-like predicted transcriptional regulator